MVDMCSLHDMLPLLIFVFMVQLCCCDSSEKFMVLGDWGGLPTSPYRTDIERHVASAMNTIAGERNTSFQIALGDNFYYDGVQSVDDKRFQETFETVFTGKYLQTPWYFVAGNHDWQGNVSAQIDYSNRSQRWNFPDFYYTKTMQSADGATLQLVLIDTIMLCGLVYSDFYYYDNDRLKPLDPKAAENQWIWIEQTLAASKADYVLVGGHYPVYSIAEHGPTQCLVEGLRPLLFKHSVTAYLSGHDHNSQHLHEDDKSSGPMDYFVLGSSNFAEDSRIHSWAVPANSSKFFNADSVGGFGLVNYNKTQMLMTIISGDNLELYQKVLKPRKV